MARHGPRRRRGPSFFRVTNFQPTRPPVDPRTPVVPRVERRSPALPARDAIVVVAAASLPLLATLGGMFVADDFFFVAILEHVTQPLHEYLWAAVTAMRDVPTTFYRPLAMGSLLAEVRAFDGDARAMHLVSLAMHAATALAVWGIARRLVAGPHARSAAVVAALAWAWFPRRVEPVAWISCRPDLLATGLAALAIWMWIEGARAHRTPLRALGVLTWGLALLAKESVAVVPLVLVAWQALDGRRSTDPWGGRFVGVAARAVALWPFVVMLAAYFALRRFASGAFIGAYGGQAIAFSATTPLKHLVYPLVPPLEFLNEALLVPTVFAVATAAAGCVALALWVAIARSWRTGAVAFGALWWIAAALPVMAFQPSLSTPFNDRLLYLPGIGAALVLAGWWATGSSRLRASMAAFLLLATVQTAFIAARWPVAGEMTARIVDEVAGAMEGAVAGEPVVVAAAPDSYRGAYVLRNGLEYALQRKLAPGPDRVAVLSHYLLASPSRMPVEVLADGPGAVRVRGIDGADEVMVGPALPTRWTTYDASPTSDRYGRRADVRMNLRARSLVLVAAPDGVRAIGRLGAPPGADPQHAPRVGPTP